MAGCTSSKVWSFTSPWGGDAGTAEIARRRSFGPALVLVASLGYPMLGLGCDKPATTATKPGTDPSAAAVPDQAPATPAQMVAQPSTPDANPASEHAGHDDPSEQPGDASEAKTAGTAGTVQVAPLPPGDTKTTKTTATRMPSCRHPGTRSEQWAWPDGEKIQFAKCKGIAPKCKHSGTRSEGWYAGDELIAYERCSQPAPAQNTTKSIKPKK